MERYCLTHSSVGTDEEMILKILKSGYLYAGFYTKNYRLFGRPEAKYVYFTLYDPNNPHKFGYNFFISDRILYHRSFRHSLGWHSEDSDVNTKVKYPKDNIKKILAEITSHIINLVGSARAWMGHEILIKKKVNLHKYLVGISSCCGFSNEFREYVNFYYPATKLFDEYPNNMTEIYN